MKKFIKKNRFTTLALVFIILLFVLLLGTKKLLFPNVGVANYGNRFKGITAIKKEDKNNLIDKIKGQDIVTEASIQVEGGIVNLHVNVKDDTSVDSSKELSKVFIDNLSDEIKKVYDLQIFITKEDSSLNNFPLIGSKTVKNDSFSWTKEREITTSEDDE